MAWTPVSGIVPQYSTNDNDLASDYWLKFYQSGTSTPFSAAIDSTGAVKLAKIKLNSSGYPISNISDENSVFIPHVDQDYRVVLFKSEADADANNTANAAFNIDGLQPQIAPLASSADVALRDITVLIQDDYDRSAKFINGRDFTAGAGPHVITVPAEWTPSNADVRFYKVDASGIVTTITPSSRDSTTFTVPITLLSTDILFLGDDRFRDQNDSDPEFIRGKLDVPSNSEAILDVADSVSTSNIQNLAITEAKMAANSVSTGKLIDGSVTSQKIGSAEVKTINIENGAVNSDKIDIISIDRAVTSGGGTWLTGVSTNNVSCPTAFSDDPAIVVTNIYTYPDGIGRRYAISYTSSASGSIRFEYISD